jgi:phosphoribosylglycinamide formyltransferase 1
MGKLAGLKKVKTAVFISGTGSNLQNLIKFSLRKSSPISINLIVSNSKKAKGLKYADQFKIKKKVLNYHFNKIEEKKALSSLKNNKINLICLAGFMKVLSANFISQFNGKIINIHPSLLPKYKGLNTHEKAIKNKDKFSGCTVHYVTKKLDSGKIIMRKKVRIVNDENPITLSKKILKQEHKLYPAAILKILTSL